MHKTHYDAKQYLKRFTFIHLYTLINLVVIEILLMYKRRFTHYREKIRN